MQRRGGLAWVLLWALSAGAAWAGSVTLDTEPIVLGRTESVGLTIKVNEVAGTESRPLRLSVNVGSFGKVERTGPGTYRTVYLPPSTRFPQVALVAVWRETGADAPIDFLRVPLYGATQIPVSARPGSEVKVEVGAQEFGPVAIKAGGSAVVPVVVPPGVPEAVIIVKDKAGVVTRRVAKVDVPPYNRMTMALVPHALLVNGKDQARLEVFYDQGDATLPVDKLKLKASVGEAVFDHAERGRYVFRYVAPKGTPDRGAVFEATVAGDAVTKASVELELGLPPPASLVLDVPDKPLPSDGHSQATIAVQVFDATGLGLPQQSIALSANGVELAEPQYRGNGRYEASFAAPTAYPKGGLVQLAAKLKGEGPALSASANFQVLPPAVPKTVALELRPRTFVADGKTKGRLVLDVRDGAGLPLRGAQLILLPDKGAASPPTEVSEGRYEAEYIAPDGAAPGAASVKLIDASGTFEQQLEVPLRPGAGLLLGVRGGYTHSLTALAGPRVGLDLWVPIRVGSVVLGAGLSATWQQAQQTVVDATGLFSSTSRANLVPMVARVGYELFATSRFSGTVGAGLQVTWAEVRSSAQRAPSQAVGVGGLGFVSAAMSLGPGQFFAEVAYAVAPVENADFRLNAGGVSFEGGYRLSLF